jgi:hypothetical protein
MIDTLTHHASIRVRQRGFRERDVEVILEHGTPTHDGVLLTSRDVSERVAEYRRRIGELERLRGAAVFLEEGHVVSVYRPSAAKVRRMIRHGRGRLTAAPARHRTRWPRPRG